MKCPWIDRAFTLAQMRKLAQRCHYGPGGQRCKSCQFLLLAVDEIARLDSLITPHDAGEEAA